MTKYTKYNMDTLTMAMDADASKLIPKTVVIFFPIRPVGQVEKIKGRYFGSESSFSTTSGYSSS